MKPLATTLIIALALPNLALAQNNPGSHFLENWDLDEDGQVTLAEATERRDDIFYTFDADEDGILTSVEYVQLDEARASDMKENGDQLGKGGQRAMRGMDLDFNDTNSDGVVTKKEFLDQSEAFVNLIDRDGDGVITGSDFGPNKS